MKRLRETATLKLCYKPLYNIAKDSFKVSFHNVRSLYAHIDDLLADENYRESNVIALTETWLTSSDKQELYSIPGFSAYRKDYRMQKCNARPHRGIMVYVKENTGIRKIHTFCSAQVECCILQLEHQKCVYQVVVLYVAPNTTVQCLKDVISFQVKTQLDTNHCIIVGGDINQDLFQENQTQAKLETMLSCRQIVSKATHSSGSLLDHIYTNIDHITTDVIETVFFRS